MPGQLLEYFRGVSGLYASISWHRSRHIDSSYSCLQVDLYRSNAVRVLCKIIDGQLLMQIERYLKQVREISGGLCDPSDWVSSCSARGLVDWPACGSFKPREAGPSALL